MNQLFLVMKRIATPSGSGSASTWISAYRPVAKSRSMEVRTSAMRSGRSRSIARMPCNSSASSGCTAGWNWILTTRWPSNASFCARSAGAGAAATASMTHEK